VPFILSGWAEGNRTRKTETGRFGLTVCGVAQGNLQKFVCAQVVDAHFTPSGRQERTTRMPLFLKKTSPAGVFFAPAGRKCMIHQAGYNSEAHSGFTKSMALAGRVAGNHVKRWCCISLSITRQVCRIAGRTYEITGHKESETE